MSQSLRAFLSTLSQQCPAWLLKITPDRIADPEQTLRQFMRCRTVYYPGSGFDGDPVAAFNASHAAHCFVYVDYLTERVALLDELRCRGFRGYSSIMTIDLQEADFGIGAWISHARNPIRYPFPPVRPYGFLEIFERETTRGEDYGSKRFAVLFLAADGHAAYDALFCQKDIPPPPFCVVLQDHGFGGNYDRWGAGGIMADIAMTQRRLPDFLLVAENTEPWHGYQQSVDPSGNRVASENQGGRMRTLWRRV